MKKLINYCKTLFERCMSEDNVNSRLMFFLHGVVTALGTLVLVIAFIFAKDKNGYDLMVLALGGVGGVAAVGRFFTKKNGGAGKGSSNEAGVGGTNDNLGSSGDS